MFLVVSVCVFLFVSLSHRYEALTAHKTSHTNCKFALSLELHISSIFIHQMEHKTRGPTIRLVNQDNCPQFSHLLALPLVHASSIKTEWKNCPTSF